MQKNIFEKFVFYHQFAYQCEKSAQIQRLAIDLNKNDRFAFMQTMFCAFAGVGVARHGGLSKKSPPSWKSNGGANQLIGGVLI